MNLVFLVAVSLATLIVLGLNVLLPWYARRQGEKRAQKLMDIFAEQFPGRCPICSYHWYGISNGHLNPDERVAVHRCPERENFGWRWHK